nr:hypothetical protein [Streptomyces hygroscopicus]
MEGAREGVGEGVGEGIGEGGVRRSRFRLDLDERGGDPGQVPFGEHAVIALEGDQGRDADGAVHRPVRDEEFLDQCVYGFGIHEAPSPR